MVVLLEDECHLLWGDVCGYAWGVRGEPLEVPMTNQKQRQTYYGALNFVTREFHLKAFPAGNSQHTQSYLAWLQELYPGNKSFIRVRSCLCYGTAPLITVMVLFKSS